MILKINNLPYGLEILSKEKVTHSLSSISMSHFNQGITENCLTIDYYFYSFFFVYTSNIFKVLEVRGPSGQTTSQTLCFGIGKIKRSKRRRRRRAFLYYFSLVYLVCVRACIFLLFPLLFHSNSSRCYFVSLPLSTCHRPLPEHVCVCVRVFSFLRACVSSF